MENDPEAKYELTKAFRNAFRAPTSRRPGAVKGAKSAEGHQGGSRKRHIKVQKAEGYEVLQTKLPKSAHLKPQVL